MTDTDRIREALDLLDLAHPTATRLAVDALLARLEAAEAVARAARDYLALSTYDADPLTWNATNLAAANELGAALAAWERSQETGQP